jgi:uncharacterized iron-regulated membrane protein
LKALWAIVGVVPAVMFVTGLLMWWNRVVRKRRSAPEVVVAEPITAAPATAGLCGPTTLDRAG